VDDRNAIPILIEKSDSEQRTTANFERLIHRNKASAVSLIVTEVYYIFSKYIVTLYFAKFVRREIEIVLIS
jgi:hypothetical protein